MPRLLAPIVVHKSFDLEDGETLDVVVEQANGKSLLQRENLLNRPWERSLSDDTIKAHIPTDNELQSLDAWLTMTECNIYNHDGKLLFEKGMALQLFREAWMTIDPAWRAMIMEAVYEANPAWFR